MSVVKADTLDIALDLVRTKKAVKPLVLNMADKYRPSGCVLAGAGMQEESLFRRTNLHSHLTPEHYPIDKEDEALYSRGVVVCLENEERGFAWLNPPFEMDFVSLPALSMPRLMPCQSRLFPDDAQVFARKVDILLQLARSNGHDALVLGALGCGAFGCPAKHVAEIFAERVARFFSRRDDSAEDDNQITHVVFAILGKNYDAFADAFGSSFGKPCS